MADWSIRIVPASSGRGAAFAPNITGYGPGDPLPVQEGDMISWNNITGDEHQPWPTDSHYNPLSEAEVLPRGGPNYLSDPIPGGDPSRPAFVIKQSSVINQPGSSPDSWTVYYYCKLHPDIQTEQ